VSADFHPHRLIHTGLFHVACGRTPEIVKQKARKSSGLHSMVPRGVELLNVSSRDTPQTAMRNEGVLDMPKENVRALRELLVSNLFLLLQRLNHVAVYWKCTSFA